jgi:Na+/proline symporter
MGIDLQHVARQSSSRVTLQLAAVLAFVAVQLAIGWWVSRRIASEDDYLLAGRSMGPLLATGTMFATWFGAESCVGSAGRVFENGVSIRSSEPFGYGLCLVLMGLVLARPLWKRRLVTLADLFRQRYSPGVERMAALLMIPTSLLWAAAQLRAFGQVLASSSTLELDVAIAAATGIALLYTVLGGLLADAITDLLQGGLLVLGLVALLVAVVVHLGGTGAVLQAIDGERVQLAPGGTGGWLATLEDWSIPILGSVVAQELVARVSAARSGAVARGAPLAAGAIYLMVGMIPVLLGLLAPSLVGELEHSEQALPRLAELHLPGLLHLVFVGALVSAILSTVDSTLLVCSSLASHDLVQPLRPGLSERARVRLARGGVLLFGLLACGLALLAESVFELVEQASAFGSAGLVVIVFLGLFTRWGGRASAYAALIAGTVVYVGASAIGIETPYLASLAAALVCYCSACAAR